MVGLGYTRNSALLCPISPIGGILCARTLSPIFFLLFKSLFSTSSRIARAFLYFLSIPDFLFYLSNAISRSLARSSHPAAIRRLFLLFSRGVSCYPILLSIRACLSTFFFFFWMKPNVYDSRFTLFAVSHRHVGCPLLVYNGYILFPDRCEWNRSDIFFVSVI